LFMDSKFEKLPDLTIEHNAVDGEVSEVNWINVNELFKHDIAFNHESTIKIFVNNLIQ